MKPAKKEGYVKIFTNNTIYSKIKQKASLYLTDISSDK